MDAPSRWSHSNKIFNNYINIFNLFFSTGQRGKCFPVEDSRAVNVNLDFCVGRKNRDRFFGENLAFPLMFNIGKACTTTVIVLYMQRGLFNKNFLKMFCLFVENARWG